jgi:hypothetical protein
MSSAAAEAKARSHQPSPAAVARAGAVGQSGLRTVLPSRAVSNDIEAARGLVIQVIQRIEGCLDDEIAALDKAPNFDLKASNDRKSQGLVDLSQAMRRLKPADVDDELNLQLQAFRAKLAVNLRKICLHLDAVKEITAMLSLAIQSAESDGTYTRHIGPQRSPT